MMTESSMKNEWILDSGCTFHMCPVKFWFEELTETEQGVVLLGNDKSCKLKGIGQIRMRMHDGVDRVIKDVRFVPELKRNLISMGTLESSGCTFKSENGTMTVTRGSLVIMKGTRMSSLYVLPAKTVVGGTTNVHKKQDTSSLWHMRLGHLSEQGLMELSKQDLLCGDKIQSLDLCDYCVLGKAKRVKFAKGKHTSTKPLEYIHSDLWEPSKTQTHGGCHYFMSIVDDYLRRVLTFLLKTKNERFRQRQEDFGNGNPMRQGSRSLFLGQEGYIKKVLMRFDMNEAKQVSTPLGQHLKLSTEQSPTSDSKRDEMSDIPYASGVWSIMYGMVCSRP